MKLSEYDFKLEHIQGKDNIVPDALSRLPAPVQSVAFERELTTEQLATLQAKDEELAQIVFQKKNNLPTFTPSALIGSSKRYAQIWKNMAIHDGVLCRKLEDDRLVTIIPRILRQRILSRIHEGGHIGAEAGIRQLRDRYYWPGMITDMENHVAQCPQCHRRNPWNKQPLTATRPIVCDKPMECWCMDFVGPLPETRSGNKYILTMCDMFSKWPEAVALPDQSAESVAKAVMSRIITTHGVPEKILTDQGRNFESQLIAELCQLTGIKKIRTSAYHPQGNGLCERFNGSLSNLLTPLVNENGTNWDAVLDIALMYYRTKPHTTNGISPYEFLFGRKARTIPEFLLPNLQELSPYVTEESYVENLKIALHRLQRRSEDNKIDKATRPEQTSPSKPLEPDQPVYLQNKAKRHKFDNRFLGPYQVVKAIDEQNVIINTGQKEYLTHRTRLKTLPQRIRTQPARYGNLLTGRSYAAALGRGGGRVDARNY
jgi:transposase InsO family protein